MTIYIYRMDEIKSLSFHIMFYHLYRGVAKYIVSGNTFSSFECLRSLYAAHHGTWRRDRHRWRTSSSLLNEGLHLWHAHAFLSTAVLKQPILSRWNTNNRVICVRVSFCVRGARLFFFADFEQLHKHNYTRQNPHLCKYPHKHNDLGLKSE